MKCFVFLTILATLLLSPVKTMAQELVLYCPFEGTGDKAVDNSGKGNDGEISGFELSQMPLPYRTADAVRLSLCFVGQGRRSKPGKPENRTTQKTGKPDNQTTSKK